MIDRVYVVDDDDISAFVTSMLLESECLAREVECFLCAEEALHKLLHGPEENWPQVIFLDLNMPVLNGWNFLDAMTAQQQRFLQRVKVFILTSSVDPQEKEMAGQYMLVKGFLRKPLDEVAITYLKHAV
ncbi:response regulator [Pontibacter sp. Tf4]|uniref:response regulator n=1 Tax=Pontibacter sp. Tf4 TaxID=2761620 RepID=UPI001629D092|nr:response regulator [Pontibacter sp. Tf4]MBB6611702.1 response regulator [Pontibacter sp. Tf4]